MATFLDIGLIQKFDLIFPFLLVVVIIWGILSNSKFLGEGKQLIHGLISLILGFIVLITPAARQVINKMAPWFVVLIMFIFFLLLLSKTEGGESNTDYGWLVKIFLIISFIIFIYSLIDVMVWNDDSNELGNTIEDGSPADSGRSGFYNTLRHPTIMGLVLIFIIGAFTIHKLSTEG
jgi:hypothetical protein